MQQAQQVRTLSHACVVLVLLTNVWDTTSCISLIIRQNIEHNKQNVWNNLCMCALGLTYVSHLLTRALQAKALPITVAVHPACPRLCTSHTRRPRAAVTAAAGGASRHPQAAAVAATHVGQLAAPCGASAAPTHCMSAPASSAQLTGQRPEQRCATVTAAQANAAASTAPVPGPQQPPQQQQDLQGKDVVMAFYEAYNVRDLQAIASLIADDISYHDLVYEEPHEGREGVMEWLNKVSHQRVPRQQLSVTDQ